VILSFPPLIIFIMLIMTIGPSTTNVIIAVVIGNAPQIARLIRGATLEIMTQDYVSAAQVRGESGLFIMFGEIVPNLRRLIFTDGCVRFGFSVVAIGVLGFLGLGLPPPTPDWGGMVKDTTKLLTVWPHMALIPAAALSSLVVGFNLLADGLQGTIRRRA
jgi:peptide/nickel transport system permease protein